jgi:hypothetical protein
LNLLRTIGEGAGSLSRSRILNTSLFRSPSAFIPMVMSSVALITVIAHLLASGGRETDEGTAAHLFQLLIAGQAPFVAFFALKWLPRMPSEAMYVMATQAAAAMVALAPVVLFDL